MMLESFTQNELRVPTRMACLYFATTFDRVFLRFHGQLDHRITGFLQPKVALCTCYKFLKNYRLRSKLSGKGGV